MPKPLRPFGRTCTTSSARYPSGSLSHLFVGARRFVTFLAVTGQVASATAIQPVAAEPRLLVEFRYWMQTHRGVTTATLNNYRATLLELLEALGDQPAQL